MGEMRDSDWSRQKLLRSDWLPTIVAPITTTVNLGDSKLLKENPVTYF